MPLKPNQTYVTRVSRALLAYGNPMFRSQISTTEGGCISGTAVALAVLQKLRIPAYALACQVVAANDAYAERLRLRYPEPSTDEEAAEWLAVADRGGLLDLTADQMARPEGPELPHRARLDAHRPNRRDG